MPFKFNLFGRNKKDDTELKPPSKSFQAPKKKAGVEAATIKGDKKNGHSIPAAVALSAGVTTTAALATNAVRDKDTSDTKR